MTEHEFDKALAEWVEDLNYGLSYYDASEFR